MANLAREFWEIAIDTVLQAAAQREKEISAHDAALFADELLLEWRARWADNGAPGGIRVRKRKNGTVSLAILRGGDVRA